MPLLTLALKRARLEKAAPFVHGDVLDLGCGPADLLARAEDRIASYTGIENNARALGMNRKRFPGHTFLQMNLETDPIGVERRYDVIVLTAVIEHIRNQEFLFGQLAPLLKPGGRVVLTSPTPFGAGVVHRLGAVIGLFSREAADTHEAPCSRRRFEALARAAGLRIKVYRRFQCGLNQLLVLARDGEAGT